MIEPFSTDGVGLLAKVITIELLLLSLVTVSAATTPVVWSTFATVLFSLIPIIWYLEVSIDLVASKLAFSGFQLILPLPVMLPPLSTVTYSPVTRSRYPLPVNLTSWCTGSSAWLPSAYT